MYCNTPTLSFRGTRREMEGDEECKIEGYSFLFDVDPQNVQFILIDLNKKTDRCPCHSCIIFRVDGIDGNNMQNIHSMRILESEANAEVISEE